MRFVSAFNDWNKEHVTKHGSTQADTFQIIEHAEDPFPRKIGNDKYLVWETSAAAQHLQVVFAFKLSVELEFASLTILHLVCFNGLPDYGGN